MSGAAQFAYRPRGNPPFPMPVLDIELSHGAAAVVVPALVDSGSTINALPYGVGLSLGLNWHSAVVVEALAGNLAEHETRGVVLFGTVAGMPPVRLAFAWSRSDNMPVLLGQQNFFSLFDLSFYASRGVFTVAPAAP